MILKDKEIIEELSKKYNFTYDKKIYCLLTYNWNLTKKKMMYNNKKYHLQWFFGCYHPFIKESKNQ